MPTSWQTQWESKVKHCFHSVFGPKLRTTCFSADFQWEGTLKLLFLFLPTKGLRLQGEGPEMKLRLSAGSASELHIKRETIKSSQKIGPTGRDKNEKLRLIAISDIALERNYAAADCKGDQLTTTTLSHARTLKRSRFQFFRVCSLHERQPMAVTE